MLGVNPENGKEIVAKDGRFGPYVTELEPEPGARSPTASVDPTTGEVVEAAEAEARREEGRRRQAAHGIALQDAWTSRTIDLDTALQLLDLPRVVGVDPESGDEITAQNGRYGPYLKKGTDTRSLAERGRRSSTSTCRARSSSSRSRSTAHAVRRARSRSSTADPVSGKPIKVKDGRFGPYVTDGTTNATIPRGESVEEIDFERAVELLADKRDKGPAAPQARKKRRRPRSPRRRRHPPRSGDEEAAAT